MEMWCLDDIGRDCWDWVGPHAWERARFNSPEWGGGSSPVKTEPCVVLCCVVLCYVVLWWWLWVWLCGCRVGVDRFFLSCTENAHRGAF